jgi:hypothetical protein
MTFIARINKEFPEQKLLYDFIIQMKLSVNVLRLSHYLDFLI